MDVEKFVENVEELKNSVESLQEEINKTDERIKSYINSRDFIASKEIRKFLNTWNEFQTTLTKDCEICKEVINTPIYIGVVGHYSHGKSSLINALISFPKSDDEVLPTGENIVTAKTTLIQFNEGAGIERFGCKKDGEMEYIDDSVFKRLVSGKMQNPWDYFLIRIGYEKSVDEELFKTLSIYNISLFDTPGLASSYWSDRSELQDWLETFDVVLLCIDGLSIGSKLSTVLLEALAICRGKLVIPIITKWDRWKECPDYNGIKNESDARQKAKDLIKKYLPLLGESLEKGLIYFISAYNYINSVEIPPELTSDFTEFWNIDQIRQELTRLVVGRKDSILKNRKDSAKLAGKRKKEILNAVNRIIDDFERLYNQCEEALPSFYLKGETICLLSDGFEEFKRRVKEKCLGISSTISNIIQEGTNSITDYKQISSLQSEIESKVQNTQKKLLEEFKGTNVGYWFNETVKNPLIKKLKSSVDDEEGRRRTDELEEDIKDLAEKYEFSISTTGILFQPVEYKSLLIKEVAIESLKNLFNTIVTYLKKGTSYTISMSKLILLNPIGVIIIFVLFILWLIKNQINGILNSIDNMPNLPWKKGILKGFLKVTVVPFLKFARCLTNKIFGSIKNICERILHSDIFIWILIALFIIFIIVYLRFFIKGWQEAKRKILEFVKEKLRSMYSFENVKKNIEDIMRLNRINDIHEDISYKLNNLLDEIQKDEIVNLYKDFSKKGIGIKQKIYDIKVELSNR